MMKWKAERDNNLLGKDDENLSELLSSVFVWLICITQMMIVMSTNLTMISYGMK
jgi:hypothetical protein